MYGRYSHSSTATVVPLWTLPWPTRSIVYMSSIQCCLFRTATSVSPEATFPDGHVIVGSGATSAGGAGGRGWVSAKDTSGNGVCVAGTAGIDGPNVGLGVVGAALVITGSGSGLCVVTLSTVGVLAGAATGDEAAAVDAAFDGVPVSTD